MEAMLQEFNYKIVHNILNIIIFVGDLVRLAEVGELSVQVSVVLKNELVISVSRN